MSKSKLRAAALIGLVLVVGEVRLPRLPGTMPSADGGIHAAPIADHFPNVPLWTQHNQAVRFYDDLVRGKLVLINFMFTSCEDLCPKASRNLANVQRALGDRMGRDVFFISITVDPGRDTPAVIDRYAKQFEAGPGWMFVTGAARDIDLIRQRLTATDTDDTLHSGMIIYGNDATGSWASMPVTSSVNAITSSVLRLLEHRR